MTAEGGRTRLRVDPVACDGIGLCGFLAAGVVALDRWGYPVVAARDLTGADVPAARRAVRACPRGALWLETADAPEGARARTA